MPLLTGLNGPFNPTAAVQSAKSAGQATHRHLGTAMCYTGPMIALAGFMLGRTAPATVKLKFYEWAYGRLAEADSDVGILGEFMAGPYIGGLEARRREKAPYDLVADDGTPSRSSTRRPPPARRMCAGAATSSSPSTTAHVPWTTSSSASSRNPASIPSRSGTGASAGCRPKFSRATAARLPTRHSTPAASGP